MTEAQFIVAQTNQTLFLQFGVHFFTKGTIYHHIGLFAACEHEWEIEDRKVFDLTGKNTGVHGSHFQSTTLNGRDVGLIAAQGTTRENIDLDFST